MPIGSRWNLRIGASAIAVDPRYNAMITVFETHVGRVDLGSGGERPIQGIATFLSSEEIGSGCGPLGEQPKRARHAMDHGFDVLDARLPRLCDLPLQGC